MTSFLRAFERFPCDPCALAGGHAGFFNSGEKCVTKGRSSCGNVGFQNSGVGFPIGAGISGKASNPMPLRSTLTTLGCKHALQPTFRGIGPHRPTQGLRKGPCLPHIAID